MASSLPADSIPALLRRATRTWGPAIAMRHRKDLDRWGILTWSEVGHQVFEIAAGLADLGIQRGDRVAIFAATRAKWSLCDYAVLTLGAVTVPVYHTSTTGQLTYLVNHCGARALIVDSDARLAQVTEARDRMRSVENVIVLDSLDLQGRERALLFSDLMRRGRRHLRRRPELPRRAIAETRPGDEATYVYTSGATGMPKGVVLTHANLLAAVRGIGEVLPVDDDDVTVLFLPLSHIYGRVGQFLCLLRGASTAYAKRIDRLEEVFLEVKPTYLMGVPIIYERIYRSMVQRCRDLSPLRRRLFHEALHGGLERIRSHDGGRPTLRRRLISAAADGVVFSLLRESFGGRLRFAVSGGAPLHPFIGEFFRVAGVEILEGYGLTETAAAATVNRLGDNRIGSVGPPIPGVRIRVAASGEVLVRGDSVFREYHDAPGDTRAAFDPAGWFRTGDTGWIDADGRLIITGRLKDLIITSGAKNVAPQHVEGALKMSPLIDEAMVFGDNRRYIVALLDLQPGALEGLAREWNLGGLERVELLEHPRVRQAIQREVDRANQRLARFEQVRRFDVLPERLSVGGGGLSHSLKLERDKVAERYRDRIDAMYEG